MKREKYKQLFEVTWEKNEKTGKPRPRGPLRRQALRRGPGAAEPAPALAAGGGRGDRGGIPGRGAHQQHGQPLSVGDALLRAVPFCQYFILPWRRCAWPVSSPWWMKSPWTEAYFLPGAAPPACWSWADCGRRRMLFFFAVLRVRGAAGPGIGLFGRWTGHRGGRRVGAASAKGAPTPGNTPVRFPFLRRAGTKLDETCRFYGHWKGIQA